MGRDKSVCGPFFAGDCDNDPAGIFPAQGVRQQPLQHSGNTTRLVGLETQAFKGTPEPQGVPFLARHHPCRACIAGI